MKSTLQVPKEDYVYRICTVTNRDRKNGEIPAVNNFSLSQKDKEANSGLSVDACTINSPEMSLAIVGAQFKFGTTTNEFKVIASKELYKLNVGYVLSIPTVQEIIYDPIKNLSPKLGFPNNEAHTLIKFNSFKDEDLPEVYVKLRDHAISFGKIPVDIATAELYKEKIISSAEL